MKSIATLAFVSLLLAGCQTAGGGLPTPKEIRAAELSPILVDAVHTGVRAGLKDPESARFGVTRGAVADGTMYACGYVNAKNSFGGYTGEKPYFGLFSNSSYSVVSIGSDAISINIVNQFCAKYGIVI